MEKHNRKISEEAWKSLRHQSKINQEVLKMDIQSKIYQEVLKMDIQSKIYQELLKKDIQIAKQKNIEKLPEKQIMAANELIGKMQGNKNDDSRKDIGVHNELSNAIEIIKKKKKEIATLKNNVNIQNGFKSFHFTNEEIEKCIDNTRKKNGKHNYAAIAREWCCDNETAKNFIKRRELANY